MFTLVANTNKQLRTRDVYKRQVDMSSTGEVGCIGDDFSEALLNSMIATGFKIPEKAVMLDVYKRQTFIG